MAHISSSDEAYPNTTHTERIYMAAKTDKAPGWLKTGDEGLKRSQELAEERAKEFGPPRFFLKTDLNNNEAKVVFLDSDGVFFLEHNLKNPQTGKWGMTFTCRAEIDTCPLCEAGHRPAYVCAHTIIDTRKWLDNKGREHHFEKKLLISKQTVQNMLAKYRKKHGTLKFAIMEFSRSKDTEASTGETVMLEGFTKEDKLKGRCPKGTEVKEWLAPFDYATLFAPKTVAELAKIAGVAPAVGSDETTPPLTDDESGKSDGAGDESIDDLL